MTKILVSDPTLRDGSHAIRHQLNGAQIAAYATAAESAGIPILEVGHGNGIGASSLQVGESLLSDQEMLQTAKEKLLNTKLGIHVIPGFATISRDLSMAIDAGVDVIRVASHSTEADITCRHIGYARKRGREVYGVLMMCHMASLDKLLEECRKLESYGAEAVMLMDSAGALLPRSVTERVGMLVDRLSIPIGFHAHNNLGLAIANSVAAVEAGASILDGTARGFGAGAGNAQLEVLVAVLDKLGYTTGIDLYKVMDAADLAEKEIMEVIPAVKSTSIVSGLAGVFSGFAIHVNRVAQKYGVDPRDIFFELGRRQVVAGQEDIIIEVAIELAKQGRDHE
jgi:4-hydroxy 2-oxovalerate aldolase